MVKPAIAAIALTAAALTLSGCDRHEDAVGPGSSAKGRYAGIGTFEADRLWAQMSGAAESNDPAAAKLADDSEIIVVIDSRTGEVRQCGNNSGYCVTMNPWSQPGQRTATPVKLKKHAADLELEGANAETAQPAR